MLHQDNELNERERPFDRSIDCPFAENQLTNHFFFFFFRNGFKIAPKLLHFLGDDP